MSNVTFQIIVFNGDYVLEQVLAPLLEVGNVVVVEGPVKYFQDKGFRTSTDNTNDILEQYLPARNILHGQWKEKDEMMSAGEKMIPDDTTHVWMVDSDEVWERAALRRVMMQLDAYDSVSFLPWTFYGGFNRILTGFELRHKWYRIQRWYPGAHWATHRPPTVLHPSDQRPMREHAHWDSSEYFFHYSYVFPRQVESKVAYYESWGAGVIPHYFERVYLRWIRASKRERESIESEFQGVHEWLPERRGGCFTRRFHNLHPHPIFERMPYLEHRFDKELKEVLRERNSRRVP